MQGGPVIRHVFSEWAVSAQSYKIKVELFYRHRSTPECQMSPPIGAGEGRVGPRNWKFYAISEYRRPAGAHPLRDVYEFFWVCGQFRPGLTVHWRCSEVTFRLVLSGCTVTSIELNNYRFLAQWENKIWSHLQVLFSLYLHFFTLVRNILRPHCAEMGTRC